MHYIHSPHITLHLLLFYILPFICLFLIVHYFPRFCLLLYVFVPLFPTNSTLLTLIYLRCILLFIPITILLLISTRFYHSHSTTVLFINLLLLLLIICSIWCCVIVDGGPQIYDTYKFLFVHLLPDLIYSLLLLIHDLPDHSFPVDILVALFYSITCCCVVDTVLRYVLHFSPITVVNLLMPLPLIVYTLLLVFLLLYFTCSYILN